MVSRKGSFAKKPIPWFWLARVALSILAVMSWGAVHPRASVWQLFLVGFVAIIAVEGLVWSCKQEQASVIKRRKRQLDSKER